MTRSSAHPRVAGLIADLRGATVVQAIVLVTALALGTTAAVKGVANQLASKADCTGDAIITLGGGAPCSDTGSGGPGSAVPTFVPTATEVPGADPTATPTAEPSATPEPVPVPTPDPTAGAEPTGTPGADPFPVPAPDPEPEPPPPPPDDGGGGNPIGDFFGGFFLGDFTDCSSIACTAGQVVSGFVPIAGDARDTVAGAITCAQGEGCTDLVFAGIGFVPVVGDLIKGGRQAGRVVRAADEVADVADTAIDVARRIPPPAGRLAEAAAKAGDVKVIGRRTDTEVAEEWPGHDVLNDPNWSLARNDEWVDEGVRNQQNFYLASPPGGNLTQTTGPFAGEPTIFSRELAQLEAAGYVRVGDYMVHPSNVADFRPP